MELVVEEEHYFLTNVSKKHLSALSQNMPSAKDILKCTQLNSWLLKIC